MIDPIVMRMDALGASSPWNDGGAVTKDSALRPTGFSDLLENLVKESDDLQKASDTAMSDFAAGQHEDVHAVMLAMTKADLSFRLVLEVRNKLVDAYQEVMRQHV